METKINIIDSCEREIEITVSNEEITPIIEKAYNEVLPEIEIKGFRKGKAPLKMVKQIYGKRIEADALQDGSIVFFNQAAKEQNLTFLGQPVLQKIEQTESGVKYHILYQVIPEFELKDYHGLAVDEPVHAVTDEEIQKVVDDACLFYGELTPSDEVTSDRFVAKINLTQIDMETRLPIIGGTNQDFDADLGNQALFPQIKDALKGKKVGDEFTIELPQSNAPNAPMNLFNCSVKEISERIPAEFNDELAKRITEGKFETAQDYRDEIGFRLQESWNQKSRQLMQNSIVNQLVDMHEFEIPEALLYTIMEDELAEIKQRMGIKPDNKQFTVESFREYLEPKAVRQAKFLVVKERIIEKEKLEVEEHDYDETVELEAERTGMDAEAIRKELQNNENFQGYILTKKFFDVILDFAVTTEVPFPDDTEAPYDVIDDDEEEGHVHGPDCDHEH